MKNPRILSDGSNMHEPDDMEPENSIPVQILYRRINCDMVGGKLRIFFDDTSKDIKDAKIDDLIKLLVGGGRPAHGLTNTALPITITENCFVVFQLADELNACFTPEKRALRVDNVHGLYFRLRHIIGKDSTQIHDGPAKEDCKIALFSAKKNPSKQADDGKYNLYVRMHDTGGNPLDVIFDPDILNPGHVKGGGTKRPKRVRRA
jgi:hypothetical protein